MVEGKQQVVNWLAVLALLVVFLLVSSGLTRESLWYDEARSMWVVQPSGPSEVFNRLDRDVHPPLYFLVLDVWVALTGESAYAVRMLSVAFAVLSLATTYTMGKRLFDGWTALMAVVILGTVGVFVHYAQEVRMYSLLLCLGTLSMWACVCWLHHPTRTCSILYSLLLAALLLTHYYAAFLVLTQALYVLLVQPRRLARWLIVVVSALALFALWTPGLFQQARARFDGALDPAQPTIWWTVGWIVSVLTGGFWWLPLVPFVMGRALLNLRRYGGSILLLLLWLLVTPLVALGFNLWMPLFYHVRYLVAILPAGALLVAYGLRHVFWRPLALLLLVSLVCVQFVTYGQFWPAKPPWEPTIWRMLAVRQPEEPSLTYVADCCAEAYYDRQLGIRDGASLDLSPRRHSALEVRDRVISLEDAPSVWLVMPSNLPETWEAAWALADGRGVGYRDGVEFMRFYRFDRGAGDALAFRFGDLLRYDGGAVSPQSVLPGEPVCADVELTALMAVDGSYSAGVHLVNASNALVAQWDGGIAELVAGERVRISPCLNILPNTRAGEYHLHLIVYDWATVERLPVIEGGGDGVSWGDALVFSVVTVDE
ncbi:MAG: glycosyltransferase family 39 protein [Anaerolineae bacterium]|nr:glycosyltransferase family 39 protein [Anaerolineae bacterium]